METLSFYRGKLWVRAVKNTHFVFAEHKIQLCCWWVALMGLSVIKLRDGRIIKNNVKQHRHLGTCHKVCVVFTGFIPAMKDTALQHRVVHHAATQTFMYKISTVLASPQQLTVCGFSLDSKYMKTKINFDFTVCHVSSGHTLLAVRAPSGTKFDVPIPKAVSPASLDPTVASCICCCCCLYFRWDDFVCAYIFFQTENSPAKYQVHLKSISGPIDVLLLNKLSAGSAPVVLPVPPPEDILRKAKLAMSSSSATESHAKSRQAATEDMQQQQQQHTSPLINPELNRMRSLFCEYFGFCRFC